MEQLAVDYIDLYLVHWPIRDSRKDTWKALEYLYRQKRVRAIGVANYLLPFLKELDTYADFVPAVDQVEFSPFLFIQDLLAYCKEKKIQLQSYTPLTKGKKLNDPRLLELAKKYGKTPAQLILRWNIQLGVSAIPKSSNAERLKENFDIFDFRLSEEDLEKINHFNEDFRLVGDPLSML
jgi:diketogulonate reductase-like aldo/keto reductase